MTTQAERRPDDEAAFQRISRSADGPSTTVTDPADDLHAWSGVFLDDGRVISIAWLRGYAGAVASTWRRYR